MQWKLIVDFGLVILIWMTQLVVYPSFTYFSEENLISWHSKYTSAVSILVMPLMLGQLVLHAWSIYQQFSWIGAIVLVLIGLAWINTFLFAVPLHNQIASAHQVSEAAEKLVYINWYRTVLWTLVFLLGMFPALKS